MDALCTKKWQQQGSQLPQSIGDVTGLSRVKPIVETVLQPRRLIWWQRRRRPSAPCFDVSTIQVVDGDLVKIMSWYDNEWGYASQMVREAVSVAGVINQPAAA